MRVKRVENLRMFFERSGKSRAFFDVLADLTQNVFEKYVGLLFSQNVQTLHERKSGVNHYGKLARKDGQFFRFNLFVATEFRNADFASFFRSVRQNDLLAPQKRAKLVLTGGDLFA